MKQDIDRLMEERNIDALFVIGGEGVNTYRDYITGGVHASATVIKKQGEDAVLIVNGMEVDEAKKSGLEVLTYVDFDFFQIMQEHRDDSSRIQLEFWRNILKKFDIAGRVAFYGRGDIMSTWKHLRSLSENLSDVIEIVEDENPTIFDVARSTKSPDELDMLADAGAKTGRAMQKTRAWLATHTVKDEVLYKEDGDPLTIGDVKKFVNKALFDEGMVDDEGMIFAQGADAGMPHSRGEAGEALRLGQSIVFDLFPKNPDNGYYHDMTRTWCLGYAPDEVKEAYDVVMHAFSQSLEAVTVGEPTSHLQKLVCDIFEEHGHPTPQDTPGTNEGYVHSLGHGLGLDVHESPNMPLHNDKILIEPGHVITIEPGLYYPSRGWGIRIEDTVYVDADGHLVNITDCPYDLVIKMEN